VLTKSNRGQSKRKQKQNKKMKFLAIIFTVLVANHVVVADVAATSTQSPKLKKHKQLRVKAHTTHTTQTQTQSMVHLPAESRIVGGTNAAAGAYPFFVQGDGCGGSLIADDIVLTAAHCAGAFDGEVYVGPNQQYSTAGGAERIAVQAEVPHPNYNSNTEAYDFMLLKLARPVSNPNLKPVPLNRNGSNPAPSDVLTVIGFGATSENGNGSNQLKQVNVDAISYNTCNQQYGGDIINELMLCAGVTGGGKDSCQGDSGGPIFNADGEQVGVVSWVLVVLTPTTLVSTPACLVPSGGSKPTHVRCRAPRRAFAITAAALVVPRREAALIVARLVPRVALALALALALLILRRVLGAMKLSLQ
jgi:trypsin